MRQILTRLSSTKISVLTLGGKQSYCCIIASDIREVKQKLQRAVKSELRLDLNDSIYDSKTDTYELYFTDLYGKYQANIKLTTCSLNPDCTLVYATDVFNTEF